MMDPSVLPGAPTWMYFDEILNSDMVQSLSQRWPVTEKNYVSMFRGVFRQLRRERDGVCHYLYNRRYVHMYIHDADGYIHMYMLYV